MAINFPNFLSVPINKPDYSGIGDFVQNYSAGKMIPNELLTKSIQAQFARPNAEESLQSLKLKNMNDAISNQFLPEQYREDLKSKKLNNIYQELVNKFSPQDYQSKFNERDALNEYRRMGGGRGGVASQQQLILQNQLMNDNGFTPEQAFEAVNNVLDRKFYLNDGTPIKIGGLAKSTLDSLTLHTTTSALVTQALKSNQADAELKVLDEYAQKGLKPYGDTVFGMNPDQIIDTFKSDDASQKKLGKFVASQALQYEAAQQRIRLANGQPGVTSTEELMKMSGQLINAKYPRLSYAARQEATRYMDEALSKGLEARNKLGIHPSDINSRKEDNNSIGAETLAKKMTLPNFNTQEEFSAWYSSQPDFVKNAVKLKLGGK